MRPPTGRNGRAALLLACTLGAAACEERKSSETSAATLAPAMPGSDAADVSAADPARVPMSGASGLANMQPSHAAQRQSAAAAAGGAGQSANAPARASDGAVPPMNVDAGNGDADAAAPRASTPDASSAELRDAGSDAATAAGQPTPPAQFVVPATGPCPEFADGYVMFAPDGVQRRVLLYMSEAARSLDGPLIFSWHSTLPNPEDATSWLGRDEIEEIKAQGGIVAAPASGYPRETRPWDNIPMGAQGVDGDQRLMDEVVACAIEKVGIDLRHIHATGMSAGGLKTAQVSLRRSGYLASVVVYSGGLTEGDTPPDQDPNNKLAAMILYGGPTDISPVDGINYTDASRRYLERLRSGGRFAFLCNHGGGHSVPRDSQASAWRFMQDHAYGAPTPYAQGLPDGFLRYCSLDP